MATRHEMRRAPNRQRGSTLVISLMVLILLMLVTVGSMLSSDTQFRLAGNLQFQNEALTQVENTLASAEAELAAPAAPPAGWDISRDELRFGVDNSGNALSTKYYARRAVSTAPTAPDSLTDYWTNSNSIEVATGQRYRAEWLGRNKTLTGEDTSIGSRTIGPCLKVNTYRVSSRVEGNRGASKTAESIYSVLSCS